MFYIPNILAYKVADLFPHHFFLLSSKLFLTKLLFRWLLLCSFRNNVLLFRQYHFNVTR